MTRQFSETAMRASVLIEKLTALKAESKEDPIVLVQGEEDIEGAEVDGVALLSHKRQRIVIFGGSHEYGE